MDKVKPEETYKASPEEIEAVGKAYDDFFKFRNYRSGQIRQLDGRGFEDFLIESRTLFWNSVAQTPSEDLENLDLNLKIPFVRKEVMEFLGRMTSLNIKPRVTGEKLDTYGVKILNAMYNKWRFKSNDKVEKFWQVLYGLINGTVCVYVGYDNEKKVQRFLDSFDPEKGTFEITEETKAIWDDVRTVIVPLEDIYLKKIYERNIQKQGKIVWRSQMTYADFMDEFGKYKDSDKVVTGIRIAEDSLYFQLLGGSGVTSVDMVEVLRVFDTENDEYKIIANGILLNKLGTKTIAPMPFKHKLMPFAWSITEPIDEKFAYGLSLPYKIKDPHKMLNASYVMLMERELRAINAPILSSDIETPEMVYKTGKIIPVGDVNAYQQLQMGEASSAFFTTLNSLQQNMTSTAQGGQAQIVPSVQPKSAKEISQLEQLRQQSIGTSILMYYDLLRQEIMLILKTMLQFYPAAKYSKETDRILKALLVPDMSLDSGGIGNVELRIVNKTSDPFDLYLEGIKRSFETGKTTEIIEAPVELIQNLEFEIHSIDLEPERTTEIEKAMWVEQATYLERFVQMGLADPAKLLLRSLEKFGISPQDIVPNQIMPQVMQNWQSMYTPQMNGMMGQNGINRATQMGANAQSPIGQAFGGASQGGQGGDLAAMLAQNA